MSPFPARVLLRDEGRLTVSLVELGTGHILWQVPVPAGRNLFSIDSERWLAGTETGFEIRSLENGLLLSERTEFPGTLAVAAGRDGALVLSSLESSGSGSIILRRLEPDGSALPAIGVPGYAYARLVTALPTGNYLVTSNQRVIEVSRTGSVVWQAQVAGPAEPHCWQALRLADGTTLVACGYAANLQLFDRKGVLIRTFTAAESARPFFFAGLQQLPSGEFLVANWQGHGETRGDLGHQVLLFDRQLNFANAWCQDSFRFSSIQGIAMVET